MNRNKYSAGAVKFALWFMEFPKSSYCHKENYFSSLHRLREYRI